MKKRILRWLPVLIWCVVIFWQSAMPGDLSGNESSIITKVINKIIGFFLGHYAFEVPELLIRKLAHFTEYFILGWLICRACLAETWTGLKLSGGVLAGVTYALTDEIHQYFVPGRAMDVRDVLIDSAGVAAGFTALLLWRKWRERCKRED